MKNPGNKKDNKIENSAVSISTAIFEPRILKNLVEGLADRHDDNGYSLEKVQPGWQAIETSTLEAYVSVDIILSDKTDLTNIPFITCFSFTCIKVNGGKYSLTFSSSLS